jgi:hypothetical protein
MAGTENTKRPDLDSRADRVATPNWRPDLEKKSDVPMTCGKKFVAIFSIKEYEAYETTAGVASDILVPYLPRSRSSRATEVDKNDRNNTG